jgi:hypothetical protein
MKIKISDGMLMGEIANVIFTGYEIEEFPHQLPEIFAKVRNLCKRKFEFGRDARNEPMRVKDFLTDVQLYDWLIENISVFPEIGEIVTAHHRRFITYPDISEEKAFFFALTQRLCRAGEEM